MLEHHNQKVAGKKYYPMINRTPEDFLAETWKEVEDKYCAFLDLIATEFCGSCKATLHSHQKYSKLNSK